MFSFLCPFEIFGSELLWVLWFNFNYGLLKFHFSLFSAIKMNDNEFQTKENKILTKDKIESQHRQVNDIYREGKCDVTLPW